MGKAQLERSKSNPFLHVEENTWRCPICGDKMFSVHETLPTTLDGNTVFHCEEHDDHTFWKNPRGPRNTIYYNKNASDSDFHYSEEYKLIDEVWVKTFPVDTDLKEIEEWINDMWHYTKDERLMCHTASDIAWTIAQYMAHVKNREA